MLRQCSKWCMLRRQTQSPALLRWLLSWRHLPSHAQLLLMWLPLRRAQLLHGHRAWVRNWAGWLRLPIAWLEGISKEGCLSRRAGRRTRWGRASRTLHQK